MSPQSPLAVRHRYASLTTLLLMLPVCSALLAAPKEAKTRDPHQQPKTYSCNGTHMTGDQVANYRRISVQTLRLLETQRSLTVSDVCSLPAAKLERAIEKAEHPKPDHPDEAVRFRKLQLEDENGFIPPDGLARAHEHIQLMKSLQKSARNEGAGIDSNLWTWLGPGNVGGRIRSIIIDPTNASNMWVGSVSGGVWKSNNAGATWQAVDDFMANLAVSSLAMNPVNPSILYAGTGEGFYNSDGIQGAGVFKSTDGGNTWTQLSSTSGSSWHYVNRLAVSPNGSVLLAATGSGIWRSSDGGGSWTQVNTDSYVKDVIFNPVDNTKAIASGSYGRAWYSLDGGLTWNPASGLPTLDWLGRVEVAYAGSNPSIVYAGVNQNNGEIWKSLDGGQTYSRVNTGTVYLGSQGWYDNAVWVDPTNPNLIVVGGIDLWRSTNGGSTLSKISQWQNAPSSAHADHHAIVSHPAFNGSTNTTVFFGDDGGIYRASNVYTVSGTSGWQELNNTLGITQFYGAAGNPTSGVVVGGTQDNGTLHFTGGSETWNSMFGGDGGFCASDPTNPNYFYGEYVFLQIHRSANAGASSSYIWNGISDAGGSNANFIAPFILDPNNPNTLLAGGASLWRSTNVKASSPTWVSIKSPAGSPISAIAVAPGNSNIIWVGHNDGDVYKTTNGTSASPTWVEIDTNSPPLPNRYVTRLTIDPNNSNIVYATFGGFNPDNIWHTLDGGLTWSEITGSGATGLPSVPVRSLVIHPNNSNWLYAGTEVGVFDSENGGATWTVPQDGPANVSVDELFWMDKRLVAATHGRGLFNTLISPPVVATAAATSVSSNAATLNGSINPSERTTSYWFEWGTDSLLSSFTSTTPQPINAGTSSVGVNSPLTSLSAGRTYYYRAAGSNLVGTSKGIILSFATTGTCAATITPISRSFSAMGDIGSFNVTASPGCSWNVANNSPGIITITSGGSGTGNGTVNYSVTSQQGSPNPRSGTLTVAGLTFTVLQGADFIDVPPSHPFYTFIGQLSARGITAGCGGGNYCPDSPVTREQMAIFIERALGVNTPPAPTQQTFADVPTAWFSYPFIEDFARRGITAGCGGGNYCPGSSVTREQMAIFIERALGVTTPPTPAQQTFQDVLTTWFSYPFIEDIYTRGITAGCGTNPLIYCPASAVTRGQMAVFLVRAFGL